MNLNELFPILTTVLTALIVLDKVAHSLGLTNVLANQLDALAKRGGALAPVEDAMRDHLKNGDDEAALSLAKAALGAVGGRSGAPVAAPK